ncbi:MAG TPA: PAS domain-containing protein, partial [Pontiella sp.]
MKELKSNNGPVKTTARLGRRFAIATTGSAILLAGLTYLTITANPDYFLFLGGTALACTAALGYIFGRQIGLKLEQRELEHILRINESHKTVQQLIKDKEFLKSETFDLKQHREFLLKLMEDADRSNKELQKEIYTRQQAENQAAQARDNMELALIGGNLGYWNWDISTNTHTFNKRFAQLLGLSISDLTEDLDWRDAYIHPDDKDRVIHALLCHLEGKNDDYSCEYRLTKGLEQWIWVLDHGRVVERNASQSPLRMIGTLLDITER